MNMKKTILITLLLTAILLSCGKDEPEHTHEWEWVVTTPATTEADGLETETCKTCGAESGNTRIIEMLPDTKTATLSNLFEAGLSTTIEGYFTVREWGNGTTGIAGKFRTDLETAYTGNIPPVQSQFLGVFGRTGTKIIVEKTTEYENWKTTGDGKTLYIRFDKLDSIQSKLTEAVQSMLTSETETDQ